MSAIRNSLHKRFVKRLFDLLGSLFLICLLSPILVVVLIVNYLCTGSNPLFLQERIGKGGKVFHVCKFRTMKVDAPSLSTAEFSNADEYITPFGKLLRATSIDELPQLFNVLIGDMSLVGPRPIITREKLLTHRRHLWNIDEVKPGITGMAQVMGRDCCTDDDKLYWDRWYVNNWCLKEDLKILFKTVAVVFTRKGNKDALEE